MSVQNFIQNNWILVDLVPSPLREFVDLLCMSLVTLLNHCYTNFCPIKLGSLSILPQTVICVPLENFQIRLDTPPTIEINLYTNFHLNVLLSSAVIALIGSCANRTLC